MRTMLVVLAALTVGCGGSGTADAQSKPQGKLTKQEQAAVEAGTRKQVIDPTATEITVDDGILKRIIAKDPSVTTADIVRMYAASAGEQYVRDFETIGKVHSANLNIRSKDGNQFGMITKFGENYTVAVMTWPTAEDRARNAELKATGAFDSPGCFQNLAAFPVKRAWQTFDEASREYQVARVKKQGGACQMDGDPPQ